MAPVVIAAVDFGALLKPLLEAILPALGTVLAAYLTYLAHQLAQKWKINLSAEQDAKLEYYAKKAAAWVEEEAARRLTRKDPNLSGDDMRDLAVSKVKEWMPQADLQKAADTIQAVLPQMGLGAAASQPKVVATTVSETTTTPATKTTPATMTVASETQVSGKVPGTSGQ